MAELMATGNASMQAQAWAIVLVMVVSLVWAAGPAIAAMHSD
jgi:hypothetical protein